MNKLSLQQMDKLYTKNNLNLSGALYVWKKADLSEEDIRKQFHYDTGVTISSDDARLLRFAVINCDSCENKDDNSLTEDAVKEPVVKMTPKVRESMIRLGPNLYRSKTAGTAWKIVMKDNIPHLARIEIEEDRDIKVAGQ